MYVHKYVFYKCPIRMFNINTSSKRRTHRLRDVTELEL